VVPESEGTNWRCGVQTCIEENHRLKDCPEFYKMEPRDRMALAERYKLCAACLTPVHSRSARKCPFKEERVDACREPACKASHHHLLHIDSFREQQGRKGHQTGPGGGTREGTCQGTTAAVEVLRTSQPMEGVD
jgi:hypothetical protein